MLTTSTKITGFTRLQFNLIYMLFRYIRVYILLLKRTLVNIQQTNTDIRGKYFLSKDFQRR